MAEVWIVLIEDRHADVDALPFSDPVLASQAAWSKVPPGTTAGELNDGMRRHGWVLYLPYGTEGDNVRVLRRAVD